MRPLCPKGMKIFKLSLDLLMSRRNLSGECEASCPNRLTLGYTRGISDEAVVAFAKYCVPYTLSLRVGMRLSAWQAREIK